MLKRHAIQVLRRSRAQPSEIAKLADVWSEASNGSS